MSAVDPVPVTVGGAAGAGRSRILVSTTPWTSEMTSCSLAAVLDGTNTTASAAFSSPGLMVPQVAVLSVTVASPFHERSLAVTDCATPVPTLRSLSV